MKRLCFSVYTWLIERFKAGYNATPWPYDDVEGREIWREGQREQKQEDAVARQVDEWQRWTSNPKNKKGPTD